MTQHQKTTPVMDALRSLLDRRRIKVTDLASNIGIPYRSLQNYLYGHSRMPLDVYIQVCEHLGVGPDYPISGRFRLNHHALQRAIADVFGDAIDRISVSEDSVLSVGTGPRSTEASHAPRVAGFLAALIAGRYDVLCEIEISEPHDDAEVGQ